MSHLKDLRKALRSNDLVVCLPDGAEVSVSACDETLTFTVGDDHDTGYAGGEFLCKGEEVSLLDGVGDAETWHGVEVNRGDDGWVIMIS